ncbi:MAG: thiamine-phosphate kinase [Actinomycetales bacterium]|nr:thiamine-phosphate kinase [Actinomycetales bacterium]
MEEDDERIARLGEDRVVAGILARLTRPATGVLVGPGDDAAVLGVTGGRVVASTDMIVEGEDFLGEWSSARDVGVKLAAQNLADVAAMGARPTALLVALAVPGDVSRSWLDGLTDGVDAECRRAGAAVVGGDISSADRIVLTGTALGVLDGPPVLRSGARPGDIVAVAGHPGRSAAGLALLASGRAMAGESGDHREVLAALVRDHVAPSPPYQAGPAAAAAGADALIDTSDGLLRDAERIARDSGVLIDLDPDALAPSADLLLAAGLLLSAGVEPPERAVGEGRRTPAGDTTAWDPAGETVTETAEGTALSWVLTGGEDHALLGCFPREAILPAGYHRIGAVREVTGRQGTQDPAVLVGGAAWRGTTGWEHFRDRPAPAVGRPRQETGVSG